MPDYEAVRTSDDGLAMQLVGHGVKLVNASELVQVDGSRVELKNKSSRASMAFVLSFTKLYPELARRSPVYAQLRNLIDMSIAAAFIQDQDYYGQIDWPHTQVIQGQRVSYQYEPVSCVSSRQDRQRIRAFRRKSPPIHC